MGVPSTKELEHLLAEESWIRVLAARLANDASAADDLVQETYLAALSSGTRPRSIRAWLGRILRNRWHDQVRSSGRRMSREHAAARPEALPSSHELVAEVELRKRVAEAVLALEEPLRRTIVLRFFQGRTLESIASDEDTSVSSVHARERRGLERLRAELDRVHGGRRERWMALMIPLAEHAGLVQASVGGLVMASALKIAAGVLVLGTGAAWWWSSHDVEDAIAARAPGVGPAAQEPAVPGDGLGIVEGPRAGRVAPAPVASTTAAATSPSIVAGRVVDPEGNGLAGVILGWHDPRDGEARTESGAGGAFELTCGRPETREQGEVASPSSELVTLIPGRAFQDWTVVVGTRVPCAGRVVDEAGVPVAGAELAFRPRPTLFYAVGVHAMGLEVRGWSATSDAEGRFALDGACGGASFGLLVHAPGFLDARVEVPDGGSRALLVTLRRPDRGTELTGIVLDPDGAPVEGARVSDGSEVVVTGANGRFMLLWTGGAQKFVQDERGTWTQARDPDVSLVAVAAGFLPASEALRGRDLALPFVLRLGLAPLRIAGDVRDSSGVPRPGIVVWIADPTRLGDVPGIMAHGTAFGRTVWVESTACGSPEEFEPTLAAITDAAGRFEIGCLMDRSYSLLASDPRTAARSGPWSIAAGTEEAELVFRDESTARVAGRVVSAGGAPRPGLRVEPRRSEVRVPGAEPPSLAESDRAVTTDAKGRFEFDALALEGTWLEVSGTNFFEALPTRVSLHDVADPSSLEIVVPVQCEVEVETSTDPAAGAVRMLDGQGAELEIHEVTGMDVPGMETGFTISPAREACLVNGRSRLLLVAETASTLVLLKDNREVARVAIRLEPGERTVLRP
jgi:RNA polymerase sigma factor (sigma-70 family)